MAFTAITAIAAGEAAITAATVLTAIAEVGTIMTVVGTVTGSEDLMKMGAVMGLVGGIGSMAMGAASGAVATGAEIADASAIGVGLPEIGTEALTAGESALSAGATSMPVLPQTELQATPLGDLGAQTTMPGAAPVAQAATPPVAATPATQAAPTVNDIAGAQGPQAQSTNSIVAPQARVTPEAKTIAAAPATGPASPPNAPKTFGEYLKSFSKFAEENKTLFSGGMQVIGGAFKGMNDASMWGDKMDVDRQKLAQTSYGNTVANFAPRGIISGAKA